MLSWVLREWELKHSYRPSLITTSFKDKVRKGWLSSWKACINPLTLPHPCQTTHTQVQTHSINVLILSEVGHVKDSAVGLIWTLWPREETHNPLCSDAPSCPNRYSFHLLNDPRNSPTTQSSYLKFEFLILWRLFNSLRRLFFFPFYSTE